MWLERLDQDGFAIIPNVLDRTEIAHCLDLLEAASAAPQGPRRGGTRDILASVPPLRAMAEHHRVQSIVASVLGETAFAVRATLFDKTSGANWKVPRHQDLTIAVDRRIDAPGYGPWSIKNDVLHVQPPSEVLQRMLTVRLHIDPCPVANGALRVIPGSHRLGRINQNDVPELVDEAKAVTCEAGPGDALVMRPLLLHASSASNQPGHRRVLHFDYAAGPLAAEMQWRMRA